MELTKQHAAWAQSKPNYGSAKKPLQLKDVRARILAARERDSMETQDD